MICTHYEDSIRCKKQASVWMQKDGMDVSCAWLCDEHAEMILDAYSQHKELLGNWSSRPLTKSEMMI